jgi:hypothetical protein
LKRVVSSVALLVASFVPTVGTASAASFSVDRVTCESGDSRFHCSAMVAGGVTPFHSTWGVTNGTAADVHDFDASGPCTLGLKVKATLTLTDSTGATVNGSGTVICRKVWPAG